SFLYAFVNILRNKNKNTLVLLLLFVGPIWFLSAFWVTQLIPRYFLLCIPPMSVMMALFFESTYKKAKAKKIPFATITLLPVLLIIASWLYATFGYMKFLKYYSYPNGMLRDVAEAPYQHLEDALTWVVVDAKKSGYEDIVLTNDL